MDVGYYLASLGENVGKLLGAALCLAVPIAAVVMLARRRKPEK